MYQFKMVRKLIPLAFSVILRHSYVFVIQLDEWKAYIEIIHAHKSSKDSHFPTSRTVLLSFWLYWYKSSLPSGEAKYWSLSFSCAAVAKKLMTWRISCIRSAKRNYECCRLSIERIYEGPRLTRKHVQNTRIPVDVWDKSSFLPKEREFRLGGSWYTLLLGLTAKGRHKSMARSYGLNALNCYQLF